METGFDDEGVERGAAPQSQRRVLLCMTDGTDRDLLRSVLSETYRIETAERVGTIDREIDCCILDRERFDRSIEALSDRENGVFQPIVLLRHGDPSEARVWESVDDVIEMPVPERILKARIDNLVERRRTAVELAEREARLETVVEELRLKERAMDKAPIGMTITDPSVEDNPIVYCNQAFSDLTGYGEDMLGTNCRILQGEDTDEETRERIHTAIENEEPISTHIVNYRRSGERFWNQVEIAPVQDEHGTVTNFVGFQSDITDRKIRERRLGVLNRVLAHNLRNKMNVIEGHLALLEEDLPEDLPASIDPITTAADDLRRLADKVQDIERILSDPDEEHAFELDVSIAQLLGVFRDRYPDATFGYDGPERSPVEIAGHGLMMAIREAVENAVKHNDTAHPTVEIGVSVADPGWCHIEIVDDGPEIPQHEVDVLQRGETPLQHADRLGIWLMYWVVSKAGGRFSIEPNEDDGNTIAFSVPTA